MSSTTASPPDMVSAALEQIDAATDLLLSADFWRMDGQAEADALAAAERISRRFDYGKLRLLADFHNRDIAGILLASGHSPTNARDLDLADAHVARRLVAEWHNTSPAVAAVRDGVLVGFMAATMANTPGQRVATIRTHQHAAALPGRREIYRRLYAALAGNLTAIGGFEHSLIVSVDHPDVLTCLFELGFGIDQIKGLRHLAPMPVTAQGIQVRSAQTADMAELLRLTVELQQFHAASPMLRPALVDLHPIGGSFREALTDARQVLLVAEANGHIVGLMQAHPDNRYLGTATIGLAVVTAAARSKGIGTALLSGVVDWASTHGFQRCGVAWSSANLVSDTFWRGHGFDPARYTLTRLIDARVSWADTRLSYRDFLPNV